MKNLKKYIVFTFVSLLLSGIIDFHGLGHLLDGDTHDNIELCEDCSFLIQQKHETNFILNASIENEVFPILVDNHSNLVDPDFVYQSYLLHKNHFNRPPPNLY